MIAQSSNNRPSGSTAKQCDAGIPVVGRTSATGTYEILKINADGSIPVTIGSQALTPPNTPSANNTYGITNGSGIIAANTFMFAVPVNIITPPTAGLYRINPFLSYTGTAGGAINLFLIEESSTLWNYCIGLNGFVDAFNPTAADMSTGLSAFWHSNTCQSFGSGIQIAYNRNNTINTYLSGANQYLCGVVDTAITLSGFAATFNYGFYEFTKV